MINPINKQKGRLNRKCPQTFILNLIPPNFSLKEMIEDMKNFGISVINPEEEPTQVITKRFQISKFRTP